MLAACGGAPVEHRVVRDDHSPPSVRVGADGVCTYTPARYSSRHSGGMSPIYEVECPPVTGPRPPGREGWLRLRPWLQLMWDHNAVSGCRMYGEAFCPPPPLELPCTSPSERTGLACSATSAETPIHVEAFDWTDAMGTCHHVEAFDCAQGCRVPDGAPC